jgi:Kef-type K+ transport system membrane component KefB
VGEGFYVGPHLTEGHLLVFLFQVLLLLALARGLGHVFRHWGHPPLVGEILVGVLLGPTILGRLAPTWQEALFPPDPIQHVMLETVSWFGVLFLLLETGLEVDVSAAWRQRGPALRIGIIGVVVPLALGFALSLGLPDHYLANPAGRLTFALFLGTTMAISAMVIIARVLADLDLVKTDLGLLTLCGYAVNDILAWLIFSLVLGLATQSTLELGPVGFLVLVTVAFTAACLTLGLRAVDRAIAYITASTLHQSGAVLTFICCLGLFCGGITQAIGLTALLGFFLAGIMAGEAQALSERVRNVLTQMVHAIFVPLYFAGIGLRMDFFSNFDAFLVVFVTVVSILGKFFGAWVGAWGTGLSRVDRLSIGIAFTPSGVTGIVVAAVALEYRVLTLPVFVAIVFSAVISSLIVGPWLAWSIRRRQQVDILEFFSRRTVIPSLRGTTPSEVIGELCAKLAEYDERLDADALYGAVHRREDLMGTGIGNGIAVPHARLAELSVPVLTFGRSIPGIDWDSPDGRPVHLVFLLLTSEQEAGQQLQILAALGQGMSSEDTRRRLAQADNSQQVWSALREVLQAQNLVRVGVGQPTSPSS